MSGSFPGMDDGRAGLQKVAGGGRGGGWTLVEAQLQGGAPWGFTLQGGLEHGEPLVISKVEEGGKADSLECPLQVGDEIIIINDIELTGYRQEAIALVKGSYKTLQITVRREFDAGYGEEFGSPPPSYLPPFSAPSPPPLSCTSPQPHQQQQKQTTRRCRPCSTGGVQLRIKNRKLRKKQKKAALGRSEGALCRSPSEASVNNLASGLISRVLRFTSRRSEPVSRPHSWHSTKVGEGQQESDQEGMDTMSSAWHHNYHASASTTDLSGGFESDGGYLRKSPDQYSSRGSMESLDPPQSAHFQHHHTLGHHSHSGPHHAYSSCQQLSSSRSSNSIDHLNSKRDSAYSSFSTSSSIPEYLASAPTFSPERSYSLEAVPQREGSGGMQQADMRYIRTVYSAQQGLSQEQELSSPSALSSRNGDSRSGEGVKGAQSRDPPGGVCYRGSSSGGNSNSALAANRHSVGPIWAPGTSQSSYENLKGAPAPPRRSDSYAAIKNHERPNSWSSVEQPRAINRSLQKGSYHHSSGPVASSSAKGSCITEGQLHTVIEKSPESSPTTKPRQGFPPPGSPSGPSTNLSSPVPPSGCLILPTGMYPVPQPEPQYAQIPSSSPMSLSLGLYPALANNSNRQQQQGLQNSRGQEEEATEQWRDVKVTSVEKGHQMNISSPYPNSLVPIVATMPCRTHESDRNQQEDKNCRHNRPFPTEGRSETQAGASMFHRQQGPQSHSPHHLHLHSNQGAYNQMLQEQDFRSLQIPSTPAHGPTGQPEGLIRRSMDQSNVHPEAMSYSRVAQGQVLPSHSLVHPQHSPSSSSSSTSSSTLASLRHHSDSAALHYHHLEQKEHNRDKEHPLTRLENALVEVQRCTSPNTDVSPSSHDNNTVGEGIQGPTRSLSVLERVSRFEHCDRAGKQRSYSINHGQHKNALSRVTDNAHGSACGAEDLRSMLERSTSKAHRTMSYRGGSINYKKDRTAPDPSSALERSLSSLQLDGSREENERKTSRKPDVQEILQETSFHRSYRNSLKDAQSKVLRSTSLRHNFSPVRPSRVASSSNSSSPHQPLPSLGNHPTSEKKGPKTMPKPMSIVISVPATSPHTPKERHVVSPEIRGPSPPALPSVPPVGPPTLLRICGRRRLTADQKKRSYSEPDSMNEIGISDPETSGLFKLGGETSVADRRKMFELGFANNAISRPDLRQLQQVAVAQYVQRKRSEKKDEGRERSGPRRLSAYLQSEKNYHSDSLSLSSTSSLLSVQDSGLDRSLYSNERRHYSSPGPDMQSIQSNLYSPGRVTTPRPPLHLPSRENSPPERHTTSTHHPSNYIQESVSNKGSPIPPKDSQEPQQNWVAPKQTSGSLAMVGSILGSGKSASVEELLERSEERLPNHARSRSSPTLERLNKVSLSDQVKMFDAYVSDPERCAKTEDSVGENKPTEGLTSPQMSLNNPQNTQPADAPPAFSHSPVPLRDRQRQRNSERQRAHSMSSLAASVGLPCPLSSACGSQDRGGIEWQSSQGLSQADLDNITFPASPRSILAENAGSTKGGAVSLDGHLDSFVVEKPTRHSLSDACVLEDITKEAHRERLFSLERRGGPCEENKQVSSVTTSTRDKEHNENIELRPLATSTGLFRDDLDEVFLLNPPSTSPSLSIKETNINEDFPLPPQPLLELDQKNSAQIAGSLSSLLPSSKPRSSTLTSTTSSLESPQFDNTLNLEYQPLLRREKTMEEMQVEMLAKQLVMQDRSLTTILGTWQGKSPVELVEEIFQNSRLGAKVPWHAIGSPLNDRVEDGVKTEVNCRTEMEEEKDLNSRKAELCEALRSSLVVMHQEKEALCEEMRCHQALGTSIDSLVYKLCKINERDKYSMFIGDLEKIVNLLLSLCNRLSRVDKSLIALQQEELQKKDASQERDSLNHKRSQLLSQTEDACELKENLDRRQRVVQAILRGYLTEPQLQDYRQFVSTKPSLLIRQRDLDDLIRQREEQLTRLAETLPPELAAAQDWLRGSLRLSSSPISCSSPFPQLLSSSLIPGHAHTARSTTVTSL
ncbi:protein Shroom3 isoform X2 [Syngnathoides biaculeatus]|uniref:protein Shroom3 isoform X2 n=1 Tax=Syngnathoides biaculeatus TaxID=300417 RepID=UPI002ADD70D5|nr:protein Shroom3 isoform X2 [Syngnathoides biaculeatus]